MNDLPILNFSENYNFQFNKNNNIFYIFDIIKKKYVILTPEEWVRQHVVHFFIYEKKISKSAIAVEYEIKLNHLSKRVDILILKKNIPHLLVECKSFNVALNQEVFNQSARYNSVLKCPFVMLSNGVSHLFFQYKGENYYPIKDFSI